MERGVFFRGGRSGEPRIWRARFIFIALRGCWGRRWVCGSVEAVAGVLFVIAQQMAEFARLRWRGDFWRGTRRFLGGVFAANPYALLIVYMAATLRSNWRVR